MKVYMIDGGTGNYVFVIKFGIIISNLLPIVGSICYNLRVNRPPAFPVIGSYWNKIDPDIQHSSSLNI